MTPDPIPPAGENPPETRSTAGMTTKVVKGSLWTLAGQIAPMAVSLIATPFVIRLLGTERYGVLILVGLIPTYLGFADFGMSIASTKFASKAYAEGHEEKEARIVRTAALMAVVASLPFGVAIFALSGWLAAVFNVPNNLLPEASVALKLASVTFIVNFLNSIFNTPQLTRLRMDLNTLVTSGCRILGLIATPIVLYFGGGIVGAVFVLMTASIFALLGHLFTSRALTRSLFDFSIDRPSIIPLAKFGLGLVIAGIAGILLANGEKGILSTTASVRALAHYSVAFTFASMMTMFSGAMVQSLLPAFSQLQTAGTREQLNSLYMRGIRLNLMWLMPTLGFLAIAAKPFFRLWAGEEFGAESVVPFYILLFGLLFNIVAYFPHNIIMAAGRTDSLAKIYWLELFPFLILVFFLTKAYGASGAAAAWSLRVIADACLLFYFAKRVGGISNSFGNLRLFLLFSLILLVPVAANIYFQKANFIVLILMIICMSLYVTFLWKKFLDHEEIVWINNRINVIVNR